MLALFFSTMTLVTCFEINITSLNLQVQEQVPKTRRNQAALVIYLSVAFGFLLLPLAAYILHDWRWLTRAPAIAALCYVPVFWWWVFYNFSAIGILRFLKLLLDKKMLQHVSGGTCEWGYMWVVLWLPSLFLLLLGTYWIHWSVACHYIPFISLDIGLFY